MYIFDILCVYVYVCVCRLANNRVRRAGAEALSSMLRVNKCVRLLDLNKNRMGNAGVEMIADALTVNNSLTSLQ